MHPEVKSFAAQSLHGWGNHPKRVIELGSQNINGSVRDLFRGVETYVGIDCQERPGVDWVGLCHDYPRLAWDKEPFDVLVSTEMLEHDPYWRLSLVNCIEMVRPGGLIILTCAGPGRSPHGVEHDTPTPGYYKNLTVQDIKDVFAQLGVVGKVQLDRGGQDLYAVGTRQ